MTPDFRRHPDTGYQPATFATALLPLAMLVAGLFCALALVAQPTRTTIGDLDNASTIESTDEVPCWQTGGVTHACSMAQIVTLAGDLIDNDSAGTNINTSTTETTVYTYTVPGGTMGAGDVLHLSLIGEWLQNSTGSQTFRMRIKWGGVTEIDYTSTSEAQNATSYPVRVELLIANLESTTAQKLQLYAERPEGTTTGTLTTGTGWGADATAHPTLALADGAINTASDATLVVTVELSSSDANHTWDTHSALLRLVRLSSAIGSVAGTAAGTDAVAVNTTNATGVDLTDTTSIAWTLTTATDPDTVEADVAAGGIDESMLKAVDGAADEECLTYETTTGDFEWQPCLTTAATAGSKVYYGGTADSDDLTIYANDGGGSVAGGLQLGGDASAPYAQLWAGAAVSPSASVGVVYTDTGGVSLFMGGSGDTLDIYSGVATVRGQMDQSGNFGIDGRLRLADADADANSACLSVSSDRVYHDTDCDGVKDAGEEFIDQVGGASTDLAPYGQYDVDNPPASGTSKAEEWIDDTASETWAWYNQESSTATVELDGVTLYEPVDLAGLNAYMVADGPDGSSTDWTMIAKMSGYLHTDAYNYSGLILIAAGTGGTPTDLYVLGPQAQSPTATSFVWARYSDYNTYTSNIVGIASWSTPHHAEPHLCLGWRYTSSTKLLDAIYSTDCKVFDALGVGTTLSAHPTTYMGLQNSSNDGTYPAAAHFEWVRWWNSALAGPVIAVGE